MFLAKEERERERVRCGVSLGSNNLTIESLNISPHSSLSPWPISVLAATATSSTAANCGGGVGVDGGEKRSSYKAANVLGEI